MNLSIDSLTNEQIRTWLSNALDGKEELPLLTPDEAKYLGIERLERTLKPATRDSLREACHRLLVDFSSKATPKYWNELLCLVGAFKNPESINLLAKVALLPATTSFLTLPIRKKILAILVDANPPQSQDFWTAIQKQDPDAFTAFALSGMLAINPLLAVDILPALPNSSNMGKAAALKLDLAWDDLSPKNRSAFVDRINSTLIKCGAQIAKPIAEWITGKGGALTRFDHVGLTSALRSYLGDEAAIARAFTPKLCGLKAA